MKKLLAALLISALSLTACLEEQASNTKISQAKAQDGFAKPGPNAPKTFSQAKVMAKEKVYLDQNKSQTGTLYCGCQWQWTGASGGQVNLKSCGYKIRGQEERAKRIEWEHIVPAWVFGHQRQCWQHGGRKNCVASDSTFAQMESDLHNLAPSIGEVNADRSNFRYGMVTSKQAPQYGQCQSKTDFAQRVFEPRNEAKGMVARVTFYMHDRYKLDMSKSQQQVLMAWNKQYPVSQWEKERDNRIAKLMGHHNPFVTGDKQWQLKASNARDDAPSGQDDDEENDKPRSQNNNATAPSKSGNSSPKTSQIKGNQNSLIYHYAHCSGYQSMSDKNAVYFDSAKKAEQQGYQLAKNCSPK